MTTQPLRVGPFARRRLDGLARRDAATVREADLDRAGAEPTTPTVAALQARANAYARREEQRFFRRMRRELAEHRILAGALRSDLDAYEDRIDAATPAGASEPDRTTLATASGPAFEELRRLERRLKYGHRRTEELTALIHARFTAAQLRAARHFDRADEKIAIYWGTLRSATAPARIAAAAPQLRRAEWFTARGTAIELMQSGELDRERREAEAHAQTQTRADSPGPARQPGSQTIEPGRPDVQA